MPSASLKRLVRELRQSTESRQRDRACGADLLKRLQSDGDPECFEQIVRRYGVCVLAAARKVLSSDADIEDVFQATFVTLWRAARTIRDPQALGGWLVGVAHRLAL